MARGKSAAFQPDVPTSDEFARTMGQVSWLATLSKRHKVKPISWIETHVSAALMFKQVRVFLKDKQPIAAIIWAYASDDLQRQLDLGDYEMKLQDWRSGPKIVVVDCISPLIDSKIFIDRFMAEANSLLAKGN